MSLILFHKSKVTCIETRKGVQVFLLDSPIGDRTAVMLPKQEGVKKGTKGFLFHNFVGSSEWLSFAKIK